MGFIFLFLSAIEDLKFSTIAVQCDSMQFGDRSLAIAVWRSQFGDRSLAIAVWRSLNDMENNININIRQFCPKSPSGNVNIQNS
jgi:hypothetical protein